MLPELYFVHRILAILYNNNSVLAALSQIFHYWLSQGNKKITRGLFWGN